MAIRYRARQNRVAVLLLLLFALIAGAGTAITPCVLPVVPALLAASGAGGRRRPLGIVLGLGITFTIAIDVLTQAERAVGLTGSAARDVAIVVLIAFGVVLLIPELAQRMQAPMSRLARFGPKTRGDGFLTGMAVGAALGFVCAPCAGPILAGVISVANSDGGATLNSTLTAVAYSVGLCLVMLLYAYGGRWVLAKIKGAAKGYRVERALGVVLLLTGVALVFNLDTKLTNFISKHENSIPGFFVDPTRPLEDSHSVQSKLASLRPTSKFVQAEKTAKDPDANQKIPSWVKLQGVKTPALKDLGKAPNFTDTQDWFNTPGGKSLSISQLKGKVVLVDFWTYTCINCIRTLPFIEGLYKTYHKYGLVVVGVETPEFSFEQEAANVRQAIQTDGLTYPVVQDNKYGTWNAYQNEYWPADYLIDANGEIRHTQFGEGDYQQEEAAVRTLLYEKGDRSLPKPTTAKAIVPSANIGSAETYLNAERDEGFAQSIQLGTHTYSYTKGATDIALDEWALNGTWTAQQPADPDNEGSITPDSSGATITGGIQAKDVYLVMTSAGNTPRTGRVLLDGKPISSKYAGTAVTKGGYFTVTKETLYNLVKLPQDAQFSITVELPKGISAYDFTFG